MKIVSAMISVTAGLLLLAMSCTSEKPEQTFNTKPAEVTKPAVETTAAAMPVSAAEGGENGAALFKQHCIKCHKGGGNVINPEKTIRREDLASRNIKTPDDIIHVMRNPGKGMMRFSEEKIPDDDAKKIGEYILKTFE